MFYVPDYRLEPPVIKTFGYCDECGGDIYQGDEVYKIDCDLIHAECLGDFFRDYRCIAEGEDE